MKINIYPNHENDIKVLCTSLGVSPTKLVNILLTDIMNQNSHSEDMINEIIDRVDGTRTNHN